MRDPLSIPSELAHHDGVRCLHAVHTWISVYYNADQDHKAKTSFVKTKIELGPTTRLRRRSGKGNY